MYYPYQTLRSTRELYIDDFLLSPPPSIDFALANTLLKLDVITKHSKPLHAVASSTKKTRSLCALDQSTRTSRVYLIYIFRSTLQCFPQKFVPTDAYVPRAGLWDPRRGSPQWGVRGASPGKFCKFRLQILNSGHLPRP